MCECGLTSRIFPKFSTRKSLVFIDLKNFALLKGEKIKKQIMQKVCVKCFILSSINTYYTKTSNKINQH